VDFVGRLVGAGDGEEEKDSVFDSTHERGHFFTFTIGQGTLTAVAADQRSLVDDS
jgi:hypothetical protein